VQAAGHSLYLTVANPPVEQFAIEIRQPLRIASEKFPSVANLA
jgi:hypothetical protein